MIFKPGSYYVGDPGFVLPNDDLRMLFAWILNKKLKPGPKELICSRRWINGEMVFDYYWLVPTLGNTGTLQDQDGNGWGFDWCSFGIIPWEWISHKESFQTHKIEFTEEFECSFNDEKIFIGHLTFNLR